MPTATYTPLATITLGSSASSVTFSNIPNTYRDLILVYDVTVSATTNVRMIINNDTTQSNYYYVSMNGGSAGVASAAFNYDDPFPFVTGQRNNGITQYLDVSATDKHKTYLGRFGRNGENVFAAALRWANTNAVTSVQMRTNSGTFNSGSTFSLFGVIS